MYVFDDKNECSGCTACKHACPHIAISMVADREGFKYPLIDEEKCTNCGICRDICPFHENYKTPNNYGKPKVFAVKNKEEGDRRTSSSGGIFPILARSILYNNGLIYGVAFDDNFKVKHIKIDSLSDIYILKGSKYVQSDLSDIFLDIKKELELDKPIMFVGTGCQTAGLKAYLRNKSYNNLFLVDLVCHGTPSPLIWENYVNLLQEKNNSKLYKFNFRDKRKGWHNSLISAELENGKVLFRNHLLDSYNGIFYSHTALRPSCHNCYFTNFRRTSDITIGDFWGIERHKSNFDDNKGVSLVLLNTIKGEELFNSVSNLIEYEESNIEEAKQRNLIMPTKPSSRRDKFWEDFHQFGYSYVARKYTTYGLKNRAKQRIIKPIISKLGILKLIRPYDR